MTRSLRVLLVAILIAVLAACFPEAKQGPHRASEEARDETARRETANTMERTRAPTLPEGRSAIQETTAMTDTPVSWDYVALGDSLAVGVGTRKGYVARY